jgi:hypothetical protein
MATVVVFQAAVQDVQAAQCWCDRSLADLVMVAVWLACL